MSSRIGARSRLVFLVALAVAGCAGAGSPLPGATRSPATFTSPTIEPTIQPTGRSRLTVSNQPSPSSARTPSAPPTSLLPTPAAGPSCSYPVDRTSSRSGTALVQDVRVGAHADYDRVVFEFRGAGVPELRLERVQPPFVKDPSGLPLTVPGTSFVFIRLVQTSGAGYATPDGQPTYTGPSSFTLKGARLTALVKVGDFEGYFTWIAGLTGPMCHQISTLASPARIVIDLRTP